MADGGPSRVAVVGILATALVGVAGTVGSWLVARDNRATQTAVAHDDRVYQKRASTYVEALLVAERQQLVALDALAGFNGGPAMPTPILNERLVFAKMLAYGSPQARAAYKRLMQLVRDATSFDVGANARFTRLKALGGYGTALASFQRIVQDELA